MTTLDDLRPALFSYLTADSSIAALVGTRVYPVKAPEDETRALIVYSRISGIGDHTLRGVGGLARPRLQIDCWAPTPDVAAQLARLVKARLDGFRGAIGTGDSPSVSVAVRGMFLADERDDYDDVAKQYRTSLDFMIWFVER